VREPRPQDLLVALAYRLPRVGRELIDLGLHEEHAGRDVDDRAEQRQFLLVDRARRVEHEQDGVGQRNEAAGDLRVGGVAGAGSRAVEQFDALGEERRGAVHLDPAQGPLDGRAETVVERDLRSVADEVRPRDGLAGPVLEAQSIGLLLALAHTEHLAGRHVEIVWEHRLPEQRIDEGALAALDLPRHEDSERSRRDPFAEQREDGRRRAQIQARAQGREPVDDLDGGRGVRVGPGPRLDAHHNPRSLPST
jgi:hypothetical protein